MINIDLIKMEAKTLKELASQLAKITNDTTDDYILQLISEIVDCTTEIEDAIDEN